MSAVLPFPEPGWFERLRDAAAEDRELAVIGRWCDLDIALVAGDRTFLLRLQDGRITEVVPDPDIGVSWSVTLRGTLEDWRRFLLPVPPPFYNDLLAMNGRVPTFSIEGDRGAFVRHLRPIGRLFEVARQIGAANA